MAISNAVKSASVVGTQAHKQSIGSAVLQLHAVCLYLEEIPAVVFML